LVRRMARASEVTARYAASGTARARANACDNRASI
jgi:hypothetical protein